MGRNSDGPCVGHERTAAEAAGKSFEIEFLKIWKLVRGVSTCAKKIAHVLFAGIAFLHTGVVGAKFSKQGFVIAEKGSRVRESLVPDDDDPAGGLEDAQQIRGVRRLWSNQWKAWPVVTKSTQASSSVVASAEPSTLVKLS